MTAVVAFAILELQTRGHRKFELAIVGFLMIVFFGLHLRPAAGRRRPGRVRRRPDPEFDGTDSVLLAVGILGATVMPHVVYLHSALTSTRIAPKSTAEKRELLRFQRLDVVLAMGLAGFINLTMLVVAAQLFHDTGTHEHRRHRGGPRGLQDAARRRRRAGLRGRAAGVRPELAPASARSPARS